MKTKNIYDYILYFILGIILLSFALLFLYAISTNKLDNSNEDNLSSPPLKENVNENVEEEKEEPSPKQEEVKKPEIIEKEEDLVSYSTEILDRKGTRIHNIKLACSKLNEKIINPGEVFSFLDTVGKMGPEQGYKKAEAFKADGTKYNEYGGGICQVSSTLYNCVLDASLEVVERHPHSRRVYYVPKNRDATIFYGQKDFKFKNNTENKIKIITEPTDTSLKITLKSITKNSV